MCNRDYMVLGETQLWFPNYSLMHLIGNVIPKSRHFCEIHHHEKSYYCLDDKQLVCIYCVYHGEHSGHKCEHVDTAKTTVGETLWNAKLKASGWDNECLQHTEFTVDLKCGKKLMKINDTFSLCC